MQIPLGIGAYSRPYAQLPEIKCENRFFEANPLGAEQVALLSRPGTKLLLVVGSGPIRTLYSQAGVFEEDLFVISGNKLYRWNGVEEEEPLEIEGTIGGTGSPVMTSVSIPGWQAVFVTDGLDFQYYEGAGYGVSSLSLTGTPITNGDVVRVGDTYYQFVAADVDDGPPDGSSGTPWRVLVGGDDEESLSNLFNAINATGIPGAVYSTAIVPNPDVRARALTDTGFEVIALLEGDDGNGIVTTTTSAVLAWSSAETAGGGVHELKPIVVPDDQAIVDLATLASYVICAIGDSQKFYWLRPGEVVFDALDFSSAESEPDHIVNLAVVGDQLWIFGESTMEPWYLTGIADQPFQRAQGRVFSQGIISATYAQFQDNVLVVGQDRVAYLISSGPERISHHGIEEIFRRWQDALAAEP